MDFEEQLEKAEKLDSPSLVGSSLRSADDSAHQNYIHPEKYKGVNKQKASRRSILNSSIGASLDDLISEGALLGSEEDFDKFLDDKGNVKSNAKFLGKKDKDSGENADSDGASAEATTPEESSDKVDSHESEAKKEPESTSHNSPPEVVVSNDLVPVLKSFYEAENYSTPNLSEYQLDHQISDHSELLNSVQSYDLSKLPSSNDREKSKSNELYAANERVPRGASQSSQPNRSSVFSRSEDDSDSARLVEADSMHTPYLPRDGRSTSRSRASVRDGSARSRSRSSSAIKPHLARGDSYKSTHEESPTKYELPPDMALEEEEDDSLDRRTRQSRPTLGDSIAAAEAEDASFHSDSITREPSLVTTGDYTNFNADMPSQRLDERTLFSVRSESSTNYLRTISRSRSRQPASREPKPAVNEKLDSNPEELVEEGALVSDDPYGQVSNLDNMLQKVLKKPLEESGTTRESKNLVNDVSAEEKETETKEQLLAEKGPSLTSEDIKVETAEAESASKPSDYVEYAEDLRKDVTEEEKEEEPRVDQPAESLIKEAHEQLVAEKAPLVTGEDIKVGLTEGDEKKESTTGADENETIDKACETSEENDDSPALKQTENDANVEKAEETSDSQEDKVENLTNDDAVSEEKEEGEKVVTSAKDDDNVLEGKETSETAAEEEAETNATKGLEDLAAETVKEQSQLTDKVIEDLLESAVEEKESEKAEDEIDASETLEGKDVTTSTETSSNTKAEVEATSKASEEDDDDIDVSPEELRKHLQSLPIYLFTSLAGGMQIVQRTNRLATILQGNGIKFEFRDLGTDEEAKKIWRRHAQGKALPGVVRGDDFIGDWKYIDDVNEEYRLHEVLYETL